MFLLTIDADSSCQNKIKSSNRDLNFNYLKDFKIDIKFTCFLRFDEQVKLDLIEAHEIGWHPHFYDEEFNYYSDMSKLNEKIASYLDEVPYKDCVRVGGCQANEETFSILSKKFKIDSSIMSGCFRNDFLGRYDWRLYDNKPYVDEMLHLPITTVQSKAFYDKNSKLRYLNPCYNNLFFKETVLKNYSNLKKLDYIMLVCHADEVCTSYEDDLITCGYKNFYSNIEFISNLFGYEFRTLSEYKV